MAETTFTFRVDSDLKEQFSEAATAHDRSGSQLLRDFMRSFVGGRPDPRVYDAWFHGQVQDALDDPRAPIASQTVESHFAKRREAARRKPAARSR
jgi:hypothetical protein